MVAGEIFHALVFSLVLKNMATFVNIEQSE